MECAKGIETNLELNRFFNSPGASRVLDIPVEVICILTCRDLRLKPCYIA